MSSPPSTPNSATPLRQGYSINALELPREMELSAVRNSSSPSPTPTTPRHSDQTQTITSRLPTSPLPVRSPLGTRPPVTISAPASPPPVTPSRSRSGSQTHAGGILPPASFFRASRPNSTARSPSAAFLSASASPIRTSGIGGVGIGLPFKTSNSPASSTASPVSATRTSALPSTFKPPALTLGGGGDRLGKRSREPLLSIGEQSNAKSADESGNNSSLGLGTGAGVRKSFERIWRKGMSVGGGNGSGASSAAPSAPTSPLKNSNRKSWVSEVEDETGAETDLEAARATTLEEQREDEEDEPRSHYAPAEDSAEMEEPRRLTIDDIGDGAAGGGVVMEMGRLSMAADSLRSRNSTRDLRESKRTADSVDGAEIRFVRGVQSLDSPRTPPVATGTSSSFDHQQYPPISPLALDVPSTPGQQSRHAHFAPSPTRSPKSAGGGTAQDPASVPAPATTSSPSGYMVPVLSPRTSKAMRNYEFHPSANRYFFKGHVITGGDSALPFVGALVVLLGIAGTWFGTTCVFWWHRGAGGQAVAIVGGYLCLLTVTSMLMTAFRDPGILPRDLDPDPPYPPTSSMTSESNPVPLPRDLRVRAGSVRVKYCVTCKTYRPPRSSHCKMCDNCVDGCDHHCQWVNNCVGRRNYTHFITFVVTASITALLVIVTAILHIYLLAHDNGYSVREALKHSIGSAVAIGISIVVIWPLMALTLYHVRLLLLNITTIEQVRNQAHRKLTTVPVPANPFTLGRWYYNVAYLVCRPPGYSWIDFSGEAMHDTRKINPGFVRHTGGGDVEAGSTLAGRDSRDAPAAVPSSWR